MPMHLEHVMLLFKVILFLSEKNLNTSSYLLSEDGLVENKKVLHMKN